MQGRFYPFKSGDVKNVGRGEGLGFNVNIPLNPIKRAFTGNSEYIFIYEKIIKPILQRYSPDMVLVSCGFDCLEGDPLGQINVTQNGVSYILNDVLSSVQSKVLVVLEGGYNLQKIPTVAECLVRVVAGEFYPNEANELR